MFPIYNIYLCGCEGCDETLRSRVETGDDIGFMRSRRDKVFSIKQLISYIVVKISAAIYDVNVCLCVGKQNSSGDNSKSKTLNRI